MKRLLSFCSIIALLSVTSLTAHATDQSDDADLNPQPVEKPLEKNVFIDDHRYPTPFRILMIAQTSLATGSPRDSGVAGRVSAEYGEGLISGEIGLSLLTVRTNLTVNDSVAGEGSHPYSSVGHYVGLPILLKVNYIERPQASCSLNIGVMPAMSLKSTSNIDVGDSAGVTYDLSRTDTFAVLGFTGAAPLGDNTEFLFDGSYDRGLTNLDHNKSYHNTLVIGLGVRFDL